MAEVTVTIQHPTGLHARPAALFVQTASRFRSRIEVTANGKTVNAKSMMAILSLGARQGTTLTLRAEGEDAADALAALKELVETNFGEGS
ncbi:MULTISPECIES: HPr family phosphocarrier protein [Thermaerobacter]|uniref:Phosphocarrier protein HPr n=1 Tax=Thermaerobacter subterraneus DSM 13965 TaxID=867903 RepID=K6Q295_9FIRM|nr:MULTISPECIES: HPr family phosphocarrier protein [Thermaerobacter]EKP95109.1 phosphotransferase system HPr (HPr) family protein [Thermaerobacter subterraneus DSM 13965]QIA27815.1 HPr family phosphocarrier protein [Thermaerobacter sp. PB12/4term]